jgi:hypothetical protein
MVNLSTCETVTVRALPRVVSPIEQLFERAGIAIALISVELWPKRVVVRLAALPSPVMDVQEREHELALEEWAAVRRAEGEGKEQAGSPPEQPGTRLLGGLQIAVEDDAGTTYRPRSSNTGGSGSEWHGDWFFLGDVPEDVCRLAVTVTSPNGDLAVVNLEVSQR